MSYSQRGFALTDEELDADGWLPLCSVADVARGLREVRVPAGADADRARVALELTGRAVVPGEYSIRHMIRLALAQLAGETG